ncbi:MAG TPA: hypothetical protein DCO72_03245 [Ruminococcus sp.]|nr:hypothetical protein [Ruminococcus sp.]
MRCPYIFYFCWRSKPQKVPYTDALSSDLEGYPLSESKGDFSFRILSAYKNDLCKVIFTEGEIIFKKN